MLVIIYVSLKRAVAKLWKNFFLQLQRFFCNFAMLRYYLKPLNNK